MKKILVVDDEKFIVQSVSKSLKKEGYNVVTAQNISEAKVVIRNEPPDLIITDVMVPYLGGFDFVDEVKQNSKTKHIPIILITGMDKAILESTHTSSEECLTKPFSSEELINAVKKYI